MAGKIYISGDKHGSMRMFFGLAEKRIISPEDILLIAGDTGYVRDDEYPLKMMTLERLFPGTICFIDGNHDNQLILNSLPEHTWHGGRVHRLGGRVFHLMRGEVFELLGHSFFVLGGARTVANNYEGEEGTDFWKGEEPSSEELQRAQIRLFSDIDIIEYIVTHEAPLSARRQIPRFKRVDDDYMLPSILQNWLAKAEEGPKFRKWYFGHMHADQEIGPKLRGIYNNLVDIETEEVIRWH